MTTEETTTSATTFTEEQKIASVKNILAKGENGWKILASSLTLAPSFESAYAKCTAILIKVAEEQGTDSNVLLATLDAHLVTARAERAAKTAANAASE